MKVIAILAALLLSTAVQARTLTWSGPTDNLASALIPDVTAVVLQSHGGDYDAGVRAAEIIQARHIHTVVRTYCESACALVFVAGNRPAAANGASFMFHPTSRPDWLRQLKQHPDDAMLVQYIQRAQTDLTRYLVTLYDLSHSNDLVWLVRNQPMSEPWGDRGNFTEIGPLELTGADMKRLGLAE